MSYKALFIGLTTIDIQYFVDHFPIPNTKIKTDAPIIAVGGPAANASITFSALGGQADFLTCIGKNNFSNLILDEFKRFGVHVFDRLNNIEFEPIIAAVITTLSNSDRTIITHHPEKLELVASNVKIDLEKYDLIFTDGFYPQISIEICKQASNAHIPVAFDGGSWKPHLINLLEYVDFAICSGNFHIPTCKTDKETISFLKNYGIKKVAISKGEKSIVSDRESIEIEQVSAIDSLGAGDVLHGSFCWYWLHNKQFEKALKLASKVATFSVQFKGTHQWIKTPEAKKFTLS